MLNRKRYGIGRQINRSRSPVTDDSSLLGRHVVSASKHRRFGES